MLESLEGNQQAYAKLLEKTARMVRGYLANSMSSAQRTDERIEDLVQDVLVAIHRKKHLYRPEMPILPWLFAIARYRLIDQVRADKRRPSTVEMDERFDFPDKKASAPEEHAFHLEELLTDLSPRQKEILVLAKAEDMPLAQIAEKFRMSLSAVKVTVHRALQKVRERQRNTGA